MRRLLIFTGIIVFWAQVTHAQNYPGISLFRYRCEANGITFIAQGNESVYASYTQIAIALTAAASSGQNQMIASGASFSLWALSSNELQVHEPKNIEGTRMVWPAHICGPVFSAPSDQPEVIAYAQSLGPGQTVAFTRVLGQGTGYAQAAPSGHTTALAEIPPQTTGSSHTIPLTHTVQPGENLFRIALRYGTTVQHLMQINNLTNAHWIYAGQQLHLG